MGGTGNVVKALEKLMKEENIQIVKDAEVTEIILMITKLKEKIIIHKLLTVII